MWDHPRGCGENIRAYSVCVIGAGSPPRMRGKPSYDGEEHEVTVDHPRGCGENDYGSYTIGDALGSPPRMRGKLSASCYIILWAGITPADAGKT